MNMTRFAIGALLALAAALTPPAAGPARAQGMMTMQDDIEARMIFRRAVEAAVWAMPMVGIRGFLNAVRNDLGGDWNDVVYFSKRPMSRHGLLTANNQTPYVIIAMNTREGPLVLDIPGAGEAAKYFGSLADIWDYPFTDVGPEGADGGRGGRYLLLPPGYDGEVPDGYIVFRPASFATYAVLRPVPVPGASDAAVEAYVRTLRLYPLAQADDPPPTRFIDAWPKAYDTLPKYDLRYFADMAAIIDEEPVQERDVAMMGLLAAIGIEKGRPFAPDERMEAILEAAIAEAYAYMHWMFETRIGKVWFEGTQWSTFNLPEDQARAGWPFRRGDRLLIDPRATLYHYATFMPRKLGKGSFYLFTLRDGDGNPFDPEGTYRLRIPADTPAGDFWSVIVYDFETYGFLEGVERVGISSLEKDGLQINADGSVDIWFAPEPPAGRESNWLPTGRPFWITLRLYGPQPPLFDGSWALGDVERVD